MHTGTGDAALDEALSVLAEGDSDRANATEQSNALAVITQRIARLFADFDITLGTPADVSISMLLEPAFVKGTPVMGHGGGGGGGELLSSKTTPYIDLRKEDYSGKNTVTPHSQSLNLGASSNPPDPHQPLLFLLCSGGDSRLFLANLTPFPN
eukprot:1159069-Pelagomonas_calceolata.AAC.1